MSIKQYLNFLDSKKYPHWWIVATICVSNCPDNFWPGGKIEDTTWEVASLIRMALK